MLVLSRKIGEKVFIGSDISFVVVEVKGNRVRIGIEAPDEIPIIREELVKPSAGTFARKEPKSKEMNHVAGHS